MAKARLEIRHDEGAIRFGIVYQTETDPGFMRLTFAKDGDFDKGVECRLGFDEFSRLVAFLGGVAEYLTDDCKPLDLGNGIYFATMRKDGDVVLAAMKRSGEKADQYQITLNAHETYALDLSLRQAAFFLAFIKGVNP